LTGGDHNLKATAAYSAAGDALFGRITNVEKGADGGPEKGDLFRFRFKATRGALTISELKAHRESEDSKMLIEGDYKKS